MADEREEFIERIYAEYAPKLERMCLYYIHYQAECRDLVDESIQKTFLRAFEEYDKLKDCEYIEAWLYKTCRDRRKPDCRRSIGDGCRCAAQTDWRPRIS